MGKPEESLRYNETHEWVRVSEDGERPLAVIGITAFAVEQLTDLVYMELKPEGTELRAGDEFGEVESVKAVSPLYSPVTGKIVDVHSDLPDRLEILNDDPYGEGWIIKVELSDPREVQDLLSFEAYQKQCAEEG